MKHLYLFILVLLFCHTAEAQYCYQNLYSNGCSDRIYTGTSDTTIRGRIDDVIFNGYRGSRIFDTGTYCGVSGPGLPTARGYSDRTHLTPVEVIAGGIYDITVKYTAGFKGGPGVPSTFTWNTYSILVDFNRDYKFDNRDAFLINDTIVQLHRYIESVGGGNQTYSTPPSRTCRIQIPANIATGTYRMRIRSYIYKDTVTDSTCRQYPFGEAHDYLVKVVLPVQGVSAAQTAAGYALSPNPANDATNLALPAGHGPLHLTLTDLQGKTIRQATLPAIVETYPITTEGLPAGMYLLRLTCEGQNPVVMRLLKD